MKIEKLESPLLHRPGKKVSLAVVWHNRPKNLDFWLQIIPQLKTPEGISLTCTIIHNCEVPAAGIKKMVEAAGGCYVARANVGMDIGAFQDVTRNRLPGFDQDFDFLLWFTDDCFPMSPDVVQKFLAPFEDDSTAVTCLEISTQIKRHIRTTGFCMSKAFAQSLKFPAEPVRTKEECYKFEHRGPNSLYEQVLAAGRKAVQIGALRESAAWDSGGGGHGWVNRRQEFERIWGVKVKGSKVIIISPAFTRYPGVVASLLLQTYHNWELHLVHDGPAPQDFPRFDDPRIYFVEEKGPRKNYGHPIREQYLQKIRAGRITGDYVLVTNDDNYHAPFYLEKLVKALDENPGAPGAYCSGMVHNYAGFPGQAPLPGDQHVKNGYNVIQVKPERGYIDCAAVLVRAKLAAAVGWPDYSHSSDWTYLNRIAQQNGGWARFKIVPGVLLVHN